MDRERLADLIEAARHAHLDLAADEWLEVLYLAGALGPPGGAEPGPSVSDERPPGAEPPSSPEQPPWSPSARLPAERAEALPDPSLFLAQYPAPAPAAEEPAGLPVRVPGTSPLVRATFAKAFRPVKRTVPDASTVQIDVPETARRVADSDVWHPVLVPVLDRWLDLALVFDDAASGPAWEPELRSLTQAIQESGAFGDVRVWRFDSDAVPAGPLTVRGGTSAAQHGRDVRELVDPTGRRAILVLSDCVGAGWADGRVGHMLATWSRLNAVAIVHLLPQRLWGRCATPFRDVRWRAGQPFTAGQPQQWRYADDHLPEKPAGAAPGRPMVPVLDFTPSALSGWATMVAGGAASWRTGVAFDPDARGHPDSGDAIADEPDEAEDAARSRIQRFRAAASPEAYRLATLLSATPLQLPVVRMVQLTVVGSRRSASWAEILLGGLVVRTGTSGAAEWEPAFDFAKGIREELLTGLTRRESLDLLHRVSDFMATRFGGSFDFLALMLLDTTPDSLAAADRPFAQVAMQVLRALGGTYADKAAAISRMLFDSEFNRDSTTPPTMPARVGEHALTAPTTFQIPRPSGLRPAPADQIWDVPQRTQNFTGRTALLDQLRQDLSVNPNRAAVLVPRALFGLGGVGKTALANEYAHRYRNEYEVVWWIPAEDPADVRRSLVDLSRRLLLPESTDQSETIRTLLTALHEGHIRSRWLLIYDNAARPDSIDGLMPVPKRQGHVLVTSRDEAWQTKGSLLEVDVFTRDESITLLRRRARSVSAEDANALAELLEDLPLALHQAAAWHAETGLPASEYRRRYDEKLALLGESELAREYPRPVGAAFGVSYDQLQTRSVAAAQLLQLCSCFGPEPIFVEMLYNARNVAGLPQPLGRQMADRSTIGRELREAGRYELIRFDQARSRFQLHRLVQRVLRRTLPAEQRQTTPRHAHSILALANPGNPDELNPEDRARHGQLSPHIQPSGIVESTDLEARRVVLDQIRYRYVVGDFAGSRDLAESTVRQWRERWGERDQLVLLARRHLATTLRSLGDLTAALQIDQEVLRLFAEETGEDSDHYLVTANGYAADLRALGRFQEALDFDRELLERHRRVLRDDDPATLRTANNYAVDLRLMGEFAQARDLDTETVRLWTEGYGADFHETLFAVSNLVRDYYGLGRYRDAFSMQIETISMHEAVVGASHLSVLMARRTIAMLLRKLGRYREAREQADANYTAYAAQFPEHHEHTVAAAMSLGNALRDESPRDLASLNRARALLENALRLYERDFRGNPFVEVCRTNLAIVLRRVGEVSGARDLNFKAREGLLAAGLSPHHPYVLCATTNLASDLAAMGKNDEAGRYSAEVLEFSRQDAIRGPDHPYTLGSALNHALDLEVTGRLAEAGSLWRDTVERFNRTLGPDHPDSQAARNRRRIDADIEPPPT